MKNRIFKYIKKAEREVSELPPKFAESDFDDLEGLPSADMERSPVERPTCYASKCGFCGKKVNPSEFMAATQSGPEQTACGNCIEMLATMNRFSKNFAIYYNSANYESLYDSLIKRVAGEVGSDTLKDQAVSLAIQFLQRSSAVLSGQTGEKDVKTGVSLKLPRVALTGAKAAAFAIILEVACKEIGMPFRRAAAADVISGSAFKDLVKYDSNGETTWAEHGIIFCNSEALPSDESIYICIAQRPEKLSGFQIIKADN